MKSIKMFRLPILVGIGAAALLVSPACKAQEVSADHFTDTGVQNVYENGPVKAAAPKLKHTAQTRQQANSPTVLEATERGPLVPSQRGSKPVSAKRKPAKTGPKKS